MLAAFKLTRLRMSVAAAAGLASLSLAAPGVAAAGCHGVNDDPNSSGLRANVRATLCLLNQKRHQHGLGSLHENRDLDKASRGHAKDMAANHYFAHGDFVGRIRSSNYLSGAGSWSVTCRLQRQSCTRGCTARRTGRTS